MENGVWVQEQAGTAARRLLLVKLIFKPRKRDVFPMLGFLGEKENSLKTDDYGRDLSSVQTLLTKQVSGGPGWWMESLQEYFLADRRWLASFIETFDSTTLGPRDSAETRSSPGPLALVWWPDGSYTQCLTSVPAGQGGRKELLSES